MRNFTWNLAPREVAKESLCCTAP